MVAGNSEQAIRGPKDRNKTGCRKAYPLLSVVKSHSCALFYAALGDIKQAAMDDIRSPVPSVPAAIGLRPLACLRMRAVALQAASLALLQQGRADHEVLFAAVCGLCMGCRSGERPTGERPNAGRRADGGFATSGAPPPSPQETRAEKHKKSTVCTQAARQKKLKGKDHRIS